MAHIELLSLISIAFFASLGHCVGMCGGIVLAYSAKLYQPKDISSPTFYILSQLPFHFIYHAGKTTSYSALGFIAGFLGHIAMPSAAFKHTILLIIGVLLVICGMAVGKFFPLHIKGFNPPFLEKILNLMRTNLLKNTKCNLYILGLCNGLLPCGIVYYFLLIATAAGSALNGAQVMAIFGICAMPSLLVLGLASTALQRLRKPFLLLSALGMIAFGLYEVYKSLNALEII